MKQKLELTKMNLQELNKLEVYEISAGHDGFAYELGKDFGYAAATFLKYVGLRKIFK